MRTTVVNSRQGEEIHAAPDSRRLHLRQFHGDDPEAMHRCFANPEAMRFWNHPVHTKPIETERAVRKIAHLPIIGFGAWPMPRHGFRVNAHLSCSSSSK